MTRFRHASLIVGLLSALAGVFTWRYAAQQFDQRVVTARIVTPAQTIPAYTVITPAMLTTRDVPRAMLDEPVYVRPDELFGRIAVTLLQPGMLVYRRFALPQAGFRLVANPSLEVVSFPVDPASAVGGQVRVGQRINIYRAVVDQTLRPNDATTAAALLTIETAAVELLAGDVPVVGVQTAQGEPVSDGGAESSTARPARTQVVQILTVAVPAAVAADIVRLAAESAAQVRLWVTLSPLSSVQVAGNR